MCVGGKPARLSLVSGKSLIHPEYIYFLLGYHNILRFAFGGEKCIDRTFILDQEYWLVSFYNILKLEVIPFIQIMLTS